MIGFVIMGLILIPLFILMIASAFGPQSSPKVSLMFTGAFLLQIIVILVGFAIFGAILGFIVP